MKESGLCIIQPQTPAASGDIHRARCVSPSGLLPAAITLPCDPVGIAGSSFRAILQEQTLIGLPFHRAQSLRRITLTQALLPSEQIVLFGNGIHHALEFYSFS